MPHDGGTCRGNALTNEDNTDNCCLISVCIYTDLKRLPDKQW